jgi:hypothetical protein
MTNPIPVGDVQLYDEYRPGLEPGPWHIVVNHTVAGVPTGAIGAAQQFVVGAPQFAIDPTLVLSQYPPAGGTGDYSAVLPHVVLKDPLLPWERTVGAAPRQPWLALLVLRDTELIGAADSPARALTGTVGSFRAAQPGVFKPLPDVGPDVSLTDPVSYIQLATATFTALTPRLADLRFLAHCRQANIADKADQGLDPDGVFAVVVANRFPVVPGDKPVRYVAHLVSVEGLDAVLVDEPDFDGNTSIALISLAGWAFNAAPARRQDFGALVDALVAAEYDGTTAHPDRLLLRLPAPAIDTATTAAAEADRRLADGFVPMAYHLRTGEDTFAWYRGPLAPVPTAPLSVPAPFPSADAALAYTPFGVLDASLAAAWQAGRSLALADRSFGQALFAFRRCGNSKVDVVLQQLHSNAFGARALGETHLAADAHTELLGMLDTALLSGIGQPAVPDAATARIKAAAATAPPPHPAAAIRAFLTDAGGRRRIADLVSDGVRPLADWLARLLLLYPVPFNLLVPDERMLPAESVRFCHLDQNWQRALFDGAVSVGLESSRDVLFHEATYNLLYRATRQALPGVRGQRTSVPAPGATDDTVSGFLLRSAVVSGWPNLAVRATGQDGAPLPVARMQHLAADVLLCLFWGVPTTVELSEPQEGLRYGVQQNGLVFLRQPVASTARPLGTQLSRTVQIWPDHQRAGDGVIDLATGVVRRLQDELAAAGAPVPEFGPADLGLQLTSAPEAVMFTQAG